MVVFITGTVRVELVAFVIATTARNVPCSNAQGLVIGIQRSRKNSITYSRIGTMCSPIAHTNPTKLVFAFLTGHVVASLVLLNSGNTLGARLGVCQNPISGFGFILTLFIPDCQLLAVAWRMRFLTTYQTKRRAASITMGDFSILFQSRCGRGDGDSLAATPWTPPSQSIGFDKRSKLIILKFGQQIGRSLKNFFFRHQFFALGFRARLADTRGSF
jgi:hypothetical protein